MNLQAVAGFSIANSECKELHSGPLEAIAWANVDWRLMTINDANAVSYALVPANMTVLLPVGITSYGRANSTAGWFSKVVSRPAVN